MVSWKEYVVLYERRSIYFLMKISLYIYLPLYLYISNQPPFTPIILIFWTWGSKSAAEDRGALGSVPNILVYKVYPFALVILLFPVIILHHLCHFRRPCRLLNPIQIQTPLLSPLLGHLRPRALLCRQTQTHDGYGCNKLYNGVMAVGNLCLHLLQYRLLHYRCQWRLRTTPIHLTYWMIPHQLVYHLVAKYAPHSLD